jgi:hypothetical protein
MKLKRADRTLPVAVPAGLSLQMNLSLRELHADALGNLYRLPLEMYDQGCQEENVELKIYGSENVIVCDDLGIFRPTTVIFVKDAKRL